MKLKSALLITITLIVGIVIGFLINGQLTHRKYKKFIEFRKEEGFKDRHYHFLQPTESQKEKIDPVMDKYAKLNSELFKGIRQEHDSLMVNFFEELKPLLDNEQIEKLEKFREMKRDRRAGDPRHAPRHKKKDR